jgi:hypothetical protein
VLHEKDLKVRTVQSYVSAILNQNQNLGFQLHHLDKRRMDRLFQGMQNNTTSLHGVAPVKPAVSADTILELSRKLYANPNDPNSPAQAAVVFGFIFALRSATIVSVRSVDIKLTSSAILFEEVNRKSKTPQKARSLVLPFDNCEPARALRAYFLFIQPSLDPQQSVFGIASGTREQPSSIINRFIATALDTIQHNEQQQLTSHCLRRGSAASMFACDVPSLRILSWGGWASLTSAQPYLQDRTWRPSTTADKSCYQWMLSL